MKLRKYIQKKKSKKESMGPNGDIVLSSRVRLARNIAEFPFPWRANYTVLEQIWKISKKAFGSKSYFQKGELIYLGDYTDKDRGLLVERHIISHDLAEKKGPRGVAFDSDESLSVMVNEEDHIRISSMFPGLSLEDCYQFADKSDNDLSADFKYAYDEEIGYLTSCPTNAGTGIRASCLVHLPGLVILGKAQPIFRELSKLGVAIRGFYGEGTQVIGDIFQISNAFTLGRSELEVIKNIEKVTLGLINYENESRGRLFNDKTRIKSEDAIFRSLGILLKARKISYAEAMSLFSRVKMGISMGLDLKVEEETIKHLMKITQPCHIQEIIGNEIESAQRDIIRADIIRDALCREN